MLRIACGECILAMHLFIINYTTFLYYSCSWSKYDFIDFDVYNDRTTIINVVKHMSSLAIVPKLSLDHNFFHGLLCNTNFTCDIIHHTENMYSKVYMKMLKDHTKFINSFSFTSLYSRSEYPLIIL